VFILPILLKHDLKITPGQEAAWELFAKTMKQRIAGMETAADAMKQLYGALTPKQREVLDGRIGQEHDD